MISMKFLWQASRKIGIDSFQLLSKVISKPVHATPRDILLREAREANSVATSILKVEKEVTLMRYHGVVDYMRSKNFIHSLMPLSGLQLPWHPKSTLELKHQQQYNSNRVRTERSLSTSTKSTTARVAFMITASQRAALSQELGYTAEQIKQLKPLEASLILQHNITPNELDGRLLNLVEEYHASLAITTADDHIEESKELSLAQVDNADDVRSTDNDVVQASGPQMLSELEADGNQMLLLPSAGSTSTDSTNEIDVDASNGTTGSVSTRLWYQVVSITDNGTEESIGIFPNESEAKLCQETKTQLAAKHTPDRMIQFQVRITRR